MPDDEEHKDEDELPTNPGISSKKVLLVAFVTFLASVGVSSGISFVISLFMAPGAGVEQKLAIPSDDKAPEGTDSRLSDEEFAVSFGEKGAVFLKLKPFVIDLVSVGQETKFLKLTLVLELHDVDMEKVHEVKQNVLRINDVLYTYLRGLYVGSFRGTSGAERLREQLLVRINRVLLPIVVDNVLFSSLLIE